MKKFYNKGLIYEWFASTKLFIILGMFFWGYLAQNIISDKIYMTKSDIAHNYINIYSTITLERYFYLAFIFIAIYFISQGINKRNNLMFLTSSPFTKKQIKYNNILCLFITLMLFVLTYIYVAFIMSIKFAPVLSIIDGYFKVTCIEVLRIMLFGISGIIFMLIIDTMFSNSIVGFIFMIAVIPESLMFMFAKIMSSISHYLSKRPFSIIERIFGGNGDYSKSYVNNFDLRVIGPYNIDIGLKNIFIFICIQLLIILTLFIVFTLIQKINVIEFSTNIFTSKTSERLTKIIASIGAASFASYIIIDNYLSKFYSEYGYDYTLSGTNLLKVLSIDIISFALVALITNLILKKIFKAVD